MYIHLYIVEPLQQFDISGKLAFELEVILSCSPSIFWTTDAGLFPTALSYSRRRHEDLHKKMTSDPMRTLLIFISWSLGKLQRKPQRYLILAVHILVHHQKSSRPENQSCLNRERTFLFLHSSCSPLAMTKSDSVPARKRI